MLLRNFPERVKNVIEFRVNPGTHRVCQQRLVVLCAEVNNYRTPYHDYSRKILSERRLSLLQQMMRIE
jgi:hypothetical protein